MRIGSAVLAGLLAFGVSVPASSQQAYDIGMRQKEAERFDEARISFRAACEAGSGKACAEFGDLLEDGDGGPRDFSAAKTYYGKACDLDIADGCAGRGSVLQKEEAFEAARPLLSKACDLGSTRGCSNLGYMYQLGKLGAADYEQAARFYEKSCALGSGVGCNNRAVLVRDGLGEPADEGRAYELFKANCEAKENANSCYSAGLLLAVGHHDRKIRYFTVACDKDLAAGCYQLGRAYNNRIQAGKTNADLERDRDLGNASFAKACKMNLERACRSKASILPRDRTRVGSAEAKRALVAYRPRAHGCNFRKFDLNANDPASVRFARNRFRENRECHQRWQRREVARLNAIVSDFSGYVRYDGRRTEWRPGAACRCQTDLDNAVGRMTDMSSDIIGRMNRRMEAFNRIMAS